MNKNKVNNAPFFVCISLLLAFVFPLYSFASQSNVLEETIWTTWKENDDIKIVYHKTKNSPLIEIKVNATIKSTLSGFLLFILDTDNIPQWLTKASSSQVLESYSPQENLFITYFESYWPVSERYMLVNSRHWQNDDLSLEIEVQDVHDKEYLDHDKIKIEIIKAHWRIEPTENNHINITYTIIADPKGVIPFWLTKRISLNGLWKTMENMHAQLPISTWQMHQLPDIVEKQSNLKRLNNNQVK